MCSEWLISVCKMIVGLTGQSDRDIFITLIRLIFQIRMLVIVGASDNCLLALVSQLSLPKNKHQIPALNPSLLTLPKFCFGRKTTSLLLLPLLLLLPQCKSAIFPPFICPSSIPTCSRAQSHSHSLKPLLVVIGRRQVTPWIKLQLTAADNNLLHSHSYL